jgi:MscS family membrane protein
VVTPSLIKIDVLLSGLSKTPRVRSTLSIFFGTKLFSSTLAPLKITSMSKPTAFHFFCRLLRSAVTLMFGVVIFMQSQSAHAVIRSDSILETADTSSPRATLNGFLVVMSERYEATMGPQGVLQSYLRSGRLFPSNHDIKETLAMVERDRAMSAKFLDLSEIPEAITEQSAWRLTLQLMEIFQQIPMPQMSEVPDANMMQGQAFKRWTVPGTEIRIGLVESGPRSGQYLFTKETVAQIPLFFERIRKVNSAEQPHEYMFDQVFNVPTGLATYLAYVVPPRWLLGIPPQLNETFFGEPIWRWISLLILFASVGWLLWKSIRLARKGIHHKGVAGAAWRILPAVTLVFMVPILCFILGEVLRVTPHLFGRITLTLWGLFYLALTWVVWGIGEIIAEWIIGLERIQTDSTDSQLVRLTGRLVSMAFGVAILIEGANRIGLPSYSIIAGLGVGGLAVALAGQQALGNLLGSLIIMFEKPFRIGHKIKTGGIEGTVENIGFRTAKLRTSDGALLIAPSSELIRYSIENMTLRDSWRIKKTLYFSLESAIEEVRGFKEDAQALLMDDFDVLELNQRVALTEIGPHGYEVLIDFVLGTSEYDKQLNACDRILSGLAAVAEKRKLRFRHSTD